MKPNIIFVLIDALRPRNLSLYGYNKETDKNIKKIAKESIIFTQNFSTSNLSYPSLTSIFSGQYPINNGIIHQYPNMIKKEIDKLRKNKFWLPLYLKKIGYENFSTCKMDFWLKKGFNFIKEGEKSDAYRKVVGNKIIKKILLRLPSRIYSVGKKIVSKRNPALDFLKPNETIDLAISKIRESVKSKKSFFGFVYFEDTHFPYPRVKNPKIKGKITLKEILKNVESKSQQDYIKKRFVDVKLKFFEQIKAKYDLAIFGVDKELGRFYNFLKQEKLWDNTIFIITSDHGDCLGEHGIYFNHEGLYDEAIHTPLIIHLPGIPPKKIDELVQSIDVAPTILDFIGEQKQKIDGKSLINLIKKNKPVRKFALSFEGLSKKTRAIRTKTRKLILSENDKCYLCGARHHESAEEYDLKEDPKELKNIYSNNSKLKKLLKY